MGQAAANRDSVHSWYHLALHVFLLLDQLATNYHVPWNPKANDSTMPVVPASPKHNTLKPTRLVDETCSPQKKKGALRARGPPGPRLRQSESDAIGATTTRERRANKRRV